MLKKKQNKEVRQSFCIQNMIWFQKIYIENKKWNIYAKYYCKRRKEKKKIIQNLELAVFVLIILEFNERLLNSER